MSYISISMKLRHFLFFVALIVIVVLAYNQFNQVQSFKDLFKTINWWILLLVIPVRYLYYRFNAKYFESFFAIFKQKARFGLVLQSSITMNFVNIVFPSGGISGLSYIRKVLKDDVDSANITLAQLSWYILSFITYLGFLLLGFVMLLMSNQVIKVSSRLVILVLFIIITVGIALILFIFNKKFVENAAYFAVKPLNKFLSIIRQKILARNRIKGFIEQLHGSLLFLRDNRDKLGKPLIYTSLMVLFDLITIYIVFLAFGQIINPGIVIAGYVIALITSLASVVTAGIGVYEAGMVATFVGLNIPFDIAFAVTIVYRIVSLWLFIPIGLIFYKKTLLDKKD